MMAERPRGWRPLSERHAELLARCATLADTPARAEALRALARRVSLFVTEGRGRFGAADVRLLTEIGDALVHGGRSLLAHPEPTAERAAEAKRRIRLGAEVLGVRDRLQQFAPTQFAIT